MLDKKKATLGILFVLALMTLGLAASSGIIVSSSSTGSPPSWSALRGVDYQPDIICGCNVGSQDPGVSSFSEISANGWNLVKVYLGWAPIVTDGSYISTVSSISTDLKNTKQYIIWDFGKNTATFWPSAVLQPYGGTPNTAFWNAFWVDSITYDGTDVWNAIWNSFWSPVITAVDSNPYTLGYQIMNEPENPGNAPLSELKAFNQFIANKMQAKIAVNHYILFMGPCPSCGYDLDTLTPETVAPTGITHLAIEFHHYDYTTMSSYALTYRQVSKALGGIPVLIGEWAACAGSTTDSSLCSAMTQAGAGTAIQTFEQNFKQYGFSNTYFAWECGSGLWGLLQKSTCSQYFVDNDIVQYQGAATTTTSSGGLSTSSSSTTTSTSSSSITTTSTSSTSSKTTSRSSSSSTSSTTDSSESTSETLSSTTTSGSSSINSTYTLTTTQNSSSQASNGQGQTIDNSTSPSSTSSSSLDRSVMGMLAVLSPAKNPPVAYGFATYELFLSGALGFAMISFRKREITNTWRW
jgi:hypothetical protein